MKTVVSASAKLMSGLGVGNFLGRYRVIHLCWRMFAQGKETREKIPRGRGKSDTEWFFIIKWLMLFIGLIYVLCYWIELKIRIILLLFEHMNK